MFRASFVDFEFLSLGCQAGLALEIQSQLGDVRFLRRISRRRAWLGRSQHRSRERTH